MKKVSREKFDAAKELFVAESNSLAKIQADKKSEMSEINTQYEPLIVGHEKIMGDAQEVMEAYVGQNRKELFEDSKTVEFEDVKIQIRATPAKLNFRKGFDLKKCVGNVEKYFKDKAEFLLKTKTELDKAALKKLEEKELKRIGVEFTTSENIIIKVK